MRPVTMAEIVSNSDVSPTARLVVGTIVVAVVVFALGRWFLRWARS